MDPNVSPGRCRVLVVDDFPAMRALVSDLISGDPAFVVVGEAHDAVDAMIRFGELEPDLVLLDLGLPSISGLQVIPMIHSARPGVKVVVLSMMPEKYYGELAERAGAAAFVSKDRIIEDLLKQMRRAWGVSRSAKGSGRAAEPDRLA